MNSETKNIKSIRNWKHYNEPLCYQQPAHHQAIKNNIISLK